MPLPLLALEPRLKVAVLHSAGFTYRRLPAEMDAVNYVSRIRMPVLMMTGRHDYVFPYQTSQKPLFDLLGTPASRQAARDLRCRSRSAAEKPGGARDSQLAGALPGTGVRERDGIGAGGWELGTGRNSEPRPRAPSPQHPNEEMTC